MEDCILEANFEFVEQPPVTLDLEVKQYFDGAGQTLKDLFFEESDWNLESEETYKLWFNRESHGLEDLAITAIYLWDESTESYKPALCDYTLENQYNYDILIDTIITLYSEVPCKGKISIFGQVITEA